MGTEAINNIKPQFNATQAKTQVLFPQTKIINNLKPDEFVNNKGMSTKEKAAIWAGIITAVLAIIAIIRFRGHLGIVNNIKDAGRRLTRNSLGTSERGNIPTQNLSRGGQNLPPHGGEGVSPTTMAKTSQNTSTQAAKNKGKTLLSQTAVQISEEQRKIYLDRLDALCKENGKKNTRSHPFFGVKFLAQNSFYDRIRRAEYKSCGNPNISEITGTATEKIRVEHNYQAGTWDYRTPIKLGKGGKSEERISLNVRPDEKLIKELDEYLSTHIDDLQAYYKTPGAFEDWFTRHDPITIYFNKKAVNQQVLDDIARITDPYARETGTSVLRGKLFGKGCAWQRQVTKADVDEFFDRFENIFGESVSNAAKLSYTNSSAGELCAFHDVLNVITGEKFEPLMPKL